MPPGMSQKEKEEEALLRRQTLAMLYDLTTQAYAKTEPNFFSKLFGFRQANTPLPKREDFIENTNNSQMNFQQRLYDKVNENDGLKILEGLTLKIISNNKVI